MKKRVELDRKELDEILERARSGALSEEDVGKLRAALETLEFLTRELEAKGVSIERLRRMLFGPTTEKIREVVGAQDKAKPQSPPDPPPKGHGRNGAAAYEGANRVEVSHESLKHGDRCPECKKGKVYRLIEPAVLVRVKGRAPLEATIYELERLRCNLCGEVFTARAPAGVGDQKYDESAGAMIGLLKYGTGLPFNRLEGLERSMGIPLPAATQWEIVCRMARPLQPPYGELIRQGAQGEVVHNDDTDMTILEWADKRSKPDERTGVFTSGIVSTREGRRIALFFTGRKHAGENLAELLSQRAEELSAPIQMCDALSRNVPSELRTILGNCLAHGRRRFVDLAGSFPTECATVLETLGEVYRNDAIAREQKMSAEQRLRFHQEKSAPRMDALEKWFEEQFELKKVEPNSTLGDAITYMGKHWQKLTLFLRVAGAPLDNTICERALKKAILHRKNSLFYKTVNGAHVGDIFMSLIHTAELNGGNPFDYLVALQRHAAEVAAHPAEWMPWNYRETLSRTQGPAPSK